MNPLVHLTTVIALAGTLVVLASYDAPRQSRRLVAACILLNIAALGIAGAAIL